MQHTENRRSEYMLSNAAAFSAHVTWALDVATVTEALGFWYHLN